MFQCLSWVHFIPAALVIHALKSLLPWLCIPLVNVQVHFIPVYPWFPRCCWSSWRFSWCIWVGQVVYWVTLSYSYCFLVHFLWVFHWLRMSRCIYLCEPWCPFFFIFIYLWVGTIRLNVPVFILGAIVTHSLLSTIRFNVPVFILGAIVTHSLLITIRFNVPAFILGAIVSCLLLSTIDIELNS